MMENIIWTSKQENIFCKFGKSQEKRIEMELYVASFLFLLIWHMYAVGLN